jgi:hypothetical protein
MIYRTKRPRMRTVLTFGVGATLAITQLGAGCVPVGEATPCGPDASTNEAGACVSPSPPDAGSEGGSDQ